MPVTGSLIAAGAGLVGQGINYVQSRRQMNDARRQLDRLSSTPVPRFNVNPAITGLYRSAMSRYTSPRGFTGAETGRFNNNLGRILNSNQAFASRFGNRNRAVAGINNSTAINALNDFAVSDARLGRENQRAAYGQAYQGASAIQGIDNMNTQADLNRRNQMEQLYGQGISTNRAYGQNLLAGMSDDLISAGVSGLAGGFGKGAPSTDMTGYSTTGSGVLPNNVFNRRMNYGAVPRFRGYNSRFGAYDPFNYGATNTGSPVDLRY